MIVGVRRHHCLLVQETWIAWRVNLMAKKPQQHDSTLPKPPTRNPVNMGFYGLMTIFGLLLHLHLEQHRFLRLAFSWSQRTGTDNTLLQGKTVEPLPIAEGTWSLTLPRKGDEEGRLKFNFYKSIPSLLGRLNFWGLIWWSVRKLFSFCSPALYWGNNK